VTAAAWKLLRHGCLVDWPNHSVNKGSIFLGPLRDQNIKKRLVFYAKTDDTRIFKSFAYSKCSLERYCVLCNKWILCLVVLDTKHVVFSTAQVVRILRVMENFHVHKGLKYLSVCASILQLFIIGISFSYQWNTCFTGRFQCLTHYNFVT
jgi:hypothetical protein